MGKGRKKEWEIVTVLSVIKQNWSVLLWFELIYKIFGLTLFFPFLKELVALMPEFINESYISQLLPFMPLSFFGAANVFMRAVEIPEFILTAITDNIIYIYVHS